MVRILELIDQHVLVSGAGGIAQCLIRFESSNNGNIQRAKIVRAVCSQQGTVVGKGDIEVERSR